MTTSFTWGIANLERETSDGYVYTVHYTVAATDGTHNASSYGSVGLQRPEGELIPFANLTSEIVIDWVKDYFGAEKVAEIEAGLEAQIAEQETPSKATGLPWS